MKDLLLAQLARVRGCVQLARAEDRGANQALKAREDARAQQHVNAAFLADSSALDEIDALKALINNLKE